MERFDFINDRDERNSIPLSFLKGKQVLVRESKLGVIMEVRYTTSDGFLWGSQREESLHYVITNHSYDDIIKMMWLEDIA